MGGSYYFTAIVTDEQGRKNQSCFMRRVSGGDCPTSRMVEQEEAKLVSRIRRQTYQPGDTEKRLEQKPSFLPVRRIVYPSAGAGYFTRNASGIETGLIILDIHFRREDRSPQTGHPGGPERKARRAPMIKASRFLVLPLAPPASHRCGSNLNIPLVLD